VEQIIFILYNFSKKLSFVKLVHTHSLRILFYFFDFDDHLYMYQHHISDFQNFKPVKSSVAMETRESNQSLYRIFVFIGELTNWPDKIVSRNRAYIKQTYLTYSFINLIF
jgi:hypothetical protein